MLTYNEATSRCWAEVDLTRLVENYRTARAHLAPETALICVLKADAYGFGAPMVAKRLQQEGARLFAVASYNEARELLDAVPGAEVLILGLCGEAQLAPAIQAGMILTVFSRRYAETVLQVAQAQGGRARIHLKVETGLNRLGLAPQDVLPTLRLLAESGCCAVEGLFSHLALRTREEDAVQIAAFRACVAEARSASYPLPMAHLCDSIGMVRYPGEHLDAVRTGAWLYGVCPRRYEHPEECQLAMMVKARIAQLHRVPAGSLLGYDETHPVGRETLVATLSAGYMDGFPRLNSQGFVTVRGKRAPVVGLVCMDQMMVDVTDISDVQEGDIVTLLGGAVSLDEYAAAANLNRNEALARTGKRVPRVYLENGQVVHIIEGLE